MRFAWCAFAALLALTPLQAQPASAGTGESPYSSWVNGPSTDPSYFPIAVWLQDPSNAGRYQAAGINLYIGLWEGPTEDQLSALKTAGMKVICDQNAVGLKHLNDPIIAGWMQMDEPDNAQALSDGSGYGPPILPEKVIAIYDSVRALDTSRPVLLNLGQGVAWDGWYGRGTRTNHPEDYPEYVKGGDIVSFDIYPMASPDAAVQGNLWYVPYGVQRLCGWAGSGKVAWNCIECTRINSQVKATPAQVRSEVWMSIIHGSRGIVYFVHEWVPSFNEHALLDDPEMLAGVTALNAQIQELAPVINSAAVESGAEVTSSNQAVPVDIMMKKYQGKTYLFASGMRKGATRATFKVSGVTGSVEVLGEGRSITLQNGTFEDDFDSYGVHLYCMQTVTSVEELKPATISISNSPNPFNPSTTISFTLPSSGRASLAVYSATGQRVRELITAQLPAGAHSVAWDGKNDSGKPVSSGIYLSRLETAGGTATGKMALMR